MKTIKKLAAALSIITILAAPATAQTTVPEGFTAGTITLANGTSLNGFVKENFKKKAAVCFMETADAKKKNYDGWELASAKISTQDYVCIKGDFFTILCSGELNFLQKATSAEGKISYNGTDPVYIGTTEGKPGDYYLYNSKTLAITLVNKTSLDDVIATNFSGYSPAIEKAKEAKQDVATLKTAVELYNKRPSK